MASSQLQQFLSFSTEQLKLMDLNELIEIAIKYRLNIQARADKETLIDEIEEAKDRLRRDDIVNDTGSGNNENGTLLDIFRYDKLLRKYLLSQAREYELKGVTGFKKLELFIVLANLVELLRFSREQLRNMTLTGLKEIAMIYSLNIQARADKRTLIHKIEKIKKKLTKDGIVIDNESDTRDDTGSGNNENGTEGVTQLDIQRYSKLLRKFLILHDRNYELKKAKGFTKPELIIVLTNLIELLNFSREQLENMKLSELKERAKKCRVNISACADEITHIEKLRLAMDRVRRDKNGIENSIQRYSKLRKKYLLLLAKNYNLKGVTGFKKFELFIDLANLVELLRFSREQLRNMTLSELKEIAMKYRLNIPASADERTHIDKIEEVKKKLTKDGIVIDNKGDTRDDTGSGNNENGTEGVTQWDNQRYSKLLRKFLILQKKNYRLKKAKGFTKAELIIVLTKLIELLNFSREQLQNMTLSELKERAKKCRVNISAYADEIAHIEKIILAMDKVRRNENGTENSILLDIQRYNELRKKDLLSLAEDYNLKGVTRFRKLELFTVLTNLVELLTFRREQLENMTLSELEEIAEKYMLNIPADADEITHIEKIEEVKDKVRRYFIGNGPESDTRDSNEHNTKEVIQSDSQHSCQILRTCLAITFKAWV